MLVLMHERCCTIKCGSTTCRNYDGTCDGGRILVLISPQCHAEGICATRRTLKEISLWPTYRNWVITNYPTGQPTESEWDTLIQNDADTQEELGFSPAYRLHCLLTEIHNYVHHPFMYPYDTIRLLSLCLSKLCM